MASRPAPRSPDLPSPVPLDAAKIAAEEARIEAWFASMPREQRAYFDRQAALCEQYGDDWERELADLDAAAQPR